MQLTAIIANALWSASNLPAYLCFCRALAEPEATQQNKLRSLLERNQQTAFGKAHGFGTIRNYEDFTRCVPVTDYDMFEPWIERVRLGEENVLTHEPVTHLVPTSGSAGARKLIPFTAGLQHEFNAAIGAWMIDLQCQLPGIIGGRAYWSVTPVLREVENEKSEVPVGFDADTAYLGGARRRLVDAILAVPKKVQRAESLDVFRYTTLLHLLRCRDLRLISVWHPSFLTLLLDTLPMHWENLLKDIARGIAGSFAPSQRRADELSGANPLKPESLWPELRVISCWGDGAAKLGLIELRRYFSKVHLQPKGLIATEAFVTLPFGEVHPLAIRSHFFEFIDDAGGIHPVGELREGKEYEVVVTTGGGLWRYRLGDRVRVAGWAEKTPSLIFLGRGGNVADLCGEKLSETFTTEAIQDVLATLSSKPRFVLLAPDKSALGYHYTLYIEGEETPQMLADCLERRLRLNPQYAYCRNLGQLLPLRVFTIKERGYETYVAKQVTRGARLGDIKPAALSTTSGWSEVFSGSYHQQHRTNTLGEPSPTMH